jgi:hypothetical protein
MSAERNSDSDATVKMPQLIPKVDDDLQDFDPEKTLVREDWETSTLVRHAG